MIHVDLDKVLLEWAYRTKRGYPVPDNPNDIDILDDVLIELYDTTYNELLERTDIKLINASRKPKRVFESEIPELNEDVIKFITSTWEKFKTKINKLFASGIQNLEVGEETVISIPASLIKETYIPLARLSGLISEVDVNQAGSMSTIKGNYNEALTIQNIYIHDGNNGISITDTYLPYESKINELVQKWDDRLKAQVDNYDAVRAIIYRGSYDMFRYLVGTVISQQAIIIGAYLDNLSFLAGAEHKADIQVAVRKAGVDSLVGYSLKLYGNKIVGLINTSPVGLARALAGDIAGEEVSKRIEHNTKLQIAINNSKKINKELSKLKKIKNPSTKILSSMNKLRILRGKVRKPINPVISEILYNVLKKYLNTPDFANNILKVIGFSDQDTKLLMAVVTDKKSEIIDKHPDLDIGNIRLIRTGTNIRVIGPTGKTIIGFGVKEGERKILAGKVSFADIEPVDLATIPFYDIE